MSDLIQHKKELRDEKRAIAGNVVGAVIGTAATIGAAVLAGPLGPLAVGGIKAAGLITLACTGGKIAYKMYRLNEIEEDIVKEEQRKDNMVGAAQKQADMSERQADAAERQADAINKAAEIFENACGNARSYSAERTYETGRTYSSGKPVIESFDRNILTIE